MRILIIYRHLWPDSPPYASMLRTIAEHLSNQGHQITIWCEQPCYKSSDSTKKRSRNETVNGVCIRRIGSIPFIHRISLIGALAKILFPLRIFAKAVFAKLKGEKYDLVWTATIPPVIQGFAGRKISNLFAAKFLYHCQDLYPEIAVKMNLWKRGGAIHRLATAIEKQNRKKADCLVTLSKDMADTVISMQKPDGRLVVINNFILNDFDAPSTKPPATSTTSVVKAQPVRVIFAGNLGGFQGLDKIVEAMRKITDVRPDIELLFLGEGKALSQLKDDSTGLANVNFQSHLPFEQAQHIIGSSDFGIVSIEPDIYKFAYPSKVLTYFGLNVPVLAIVEQQSELSRLIGSENLGYVADGRDSDSIARMFIGIENNPDQISEMKSRVSNVHENLLKTDRRLEQWTDVMERLSD